MLLFLLLKPGQVPSFASLQRSTRGPGSKTGWPIQAQGCFDMNQHSEEESCNHCDCNFDFPFFLRKKRTPNSLYSKYEEFIRPFLLKMLSVL